MRWRATCASSPSSKCRSRSRRRRRAWRVLASTLDEREQQALLAAMPQRSDAVTRLVMNIAGVDHQALVIPLDDNDRRTHRRGAASLARRARWRPSSGCATR